MSRMSQALIYPGKAEEEDPISEMLDGCCQSTFEITCFVDFKDGQRVRKKETCEERLRALSIFSLQKKECRGILQETKWIL